MHADTIQCCHCIWKPLHAAQATKMAGCWALAWAQATARGQLPVAARQPQRRPLNHLQSRRWRCAAPATAGGAPRSLRPRPPPSRPRSQLHLLFLLVRPAAPAQGTCTAQACHSIA